MLQLFFQYLITVIPTITNYTIKDTDACIVISKKQLIPFLFFLKNHTQTQYKIFTDLCVVDYPERQQRFEVIYNLFSLQYNTRLKIKLQINEFDVLPTITSIYINANWWEREAWDMFGVFFYNHPDLRRILSDYGFEGHPLQKNFPLSGYTEVRYSELKKRVIYETVNLSQEYRFFHFDNKWALS